MTATQVHTPLAGSSGPAARPTKPPRFGGLFWNLARMSSGLMVALGGGGRFPPFALIQHHGRRSGRRYETIVAARRVDDGFVISLAFGDQVHWFRNLLASDSCVVRWDGIDYPVVRPERIDWATARSAFHPIQRLFLGLARIDGFVRLHDAP